MKLEAFADILKVESGLATDVAGVTQDSRKAAPGFVFFLINQINATYMVPFFTNPQLTVVGLGGLCWMAIGAFIMKKMISFEI